MSSVPGTNSSDDSGTSRSGGRGTGGDAESSQAVPARNSVVGAQKEQFGGFKFGSAFFGWLTATGMAVILTAILTAAGAAVGVTTDTKVGQVTKTASKDATTVGLVGAIVLLVILLIAYFCGGYVAGRMARFNGLKQGLAVWLWAVIIAILVAIAAVVAGSKYDVLNKLNSFPRIPTSGGRLTTAGIITVIALAIAALIGALLGGLAGMRFHRKVDRVGFDD